MMSRKLPPGPAGLPVLGSVFPWLRDQPGFLLETYRRYGDVVRFEFLGYHRAILHGAQANRLIGHAPVGSWARESCLSTNQRTDSSVG